MPLTSEPDAALLAAYRAALDRVPTLTRVVFLLHRIDDLARKIQRGLADVA